MKMMKRTHITHWRRTCCLPCIVKSLSQRLHDIIHLKNIVAYLFWLFLSKFNPQEKCCIKIIAQSVWLTLAGWKGIALYKDIPFFILIPSKDGKFLLRKVEYGFFSSKEMPKFEIFSFFKGAPNVNPSAFFLQRVPIKIWGVGFGGHL